MSFSSSRVDFIVLVRVVVLVLDNVRAGISLVQIKIMPFRYCVRAGGHLAAGPHEGDFSLPEMKNRNAFHQICTCEYEDAYDDEDEDGRSLMRFL